MTQQSRKTPQGKPISNHRLFPAIVALWFGALFGLGSLAIRPSLIETLVISSHIDHIIPAAAPPLGDTARILLAVILAALGALLGAAIGTRIARPSTDVHQWEEDMGPTGDPVDQRSQEAGDEIGDAQPAPALRRRSPAHPEQAGRNEHPEFAPLPGGAPQILRIGEIDFDAPMEAGSRPDPVSLDDASEVDCSTPGVSAGSSGAVVDDITQAEDLEALDMVSLAERLVLSMKHRRAQIAMPGALQPAPLDNGQDIVSPFSLEADAEALTEATADQFDDEAEEAIDEDNGYSSLLNLSWAPGRNQTLARLEDEPVVIFPGQTARAAAAAMPLQSSTTSPASQEQTNRDAETDSDPGEVSSIAPTGFRRFGALTSAGKQRSSTTNQDLAMQDSLETERALRAALTSLQRMTGTA